MIDAWGVSVLFRNVRSEHVSTAEWRTYRNISYFMQYDYSHKILSLIYTVTSTILVEKIQTELCNKSYIFPGIRPCSPLKINQRSWGTCLPHLQSRKISQTRNYHESR
jgi:hypothetical protein